MTEKKKLTAVIASGAVLVLLLIAYFVILPLLSDNTDTVTPPELVEGEVLGADNRILMFPQANKTFIKSVEIENEHGEFTILRDGTNFVIEDHEDVTVNSEAISYLAVGAGYTISRERVTTTATEEELTRYGFDEPIAKWTLTTIDGTSYTVKVGSKLVSGDGYYAMLEGREECVYILSTTLENGVLKPVEYFATPVLCSGVTAENYYYVDGFTVMHGEEAFVVVEQCDKDEYINPDAMAETKLVYPAGYKTDDVFFMSNVAAKFISLTGEEVVYLGEDEEVYAEYGLADPYYKVLFRLPFNKGYVDYFFFISEKQEDGCYYVLSNENGYQYITRCSADTFDWLDEDLNKWVDDYPIAINIAYVDSITVDTGDDSLTFDLIHGVDEKKKATLEVKADNGFELSNKEIYNFREFYKVLLAVQIMDSVGMSDKKIDKLMADESAHMLTVTFNMSDGEKNEYSFYRYSTRRALLSANGNTDFYVLADWIEKIESDLSRLLAGLEIESHSKK